MKPVLDALYADDVLMDLLHPESWHKAVACHSSDLFFEIRRRGTENVRRRVQALRAGVAPQILVSG
jgi:hypothetical protein